MITDITSLESLKILIVEDSKTDAILIEKAITQAISIQHNLVKVETLAAALRVVTEEGFDVVLLDLSLPDTIEFSGLLSIQNMAPKLPIIILTAHADEALALKAVVHGAQDYLFKDQANGHAIKRSIQFAIQRKQFEGVLITQANFDTLTGLANRLLFESRLYMAIARSERSGCGIGVFFLDLNRFKQVNDTLGHAAGDQLLRRVAECLKQSIRPYDTAARFGGDEFALLIEGLDHARDCAAIGRKIIHQMETIAVIDNTPVDIGVSIGIATNITKEVMTPAAFMKQADEAMYIAKLNRESSCAFYDAAIDQYGIVKTKLRLDQPLE